jgi:hypothetical protein
MLSGRGVSVSGSNTVPVEESAAEYEGSAGVSSGAGYSYGTGGAAPITIINQVPNTDTADLQAQLAASKANAAKLKERGNNWAEWGMKWKDIAKGTPGLRTPLSLPKNASVKAGTKRVGTQGTQIVKKKTPTIARTQTKVPLSATGGK